MFGFAFGIALIVGAIAMGVMLKRTWKRIDGDSRLMWILLVVMFGGAGAFFVKATVPQLLP